MLNKFSFILLKLYHINSITSILWLSFITHRSWYFSAFNIYTTGMTNVLIITKEIPIFLQTPITFTLMTEWNPHFISIKLFYSKIIFLPKKIQLTFILTLTRYTHFYLSHTYKQLQYVKILSSTKYHFRKKLNRVMKK